MIKGLRKYILFAGMMLVISLAVMAKDDWILVNSRQEKDVVAVPARIASLDSLRYNAVDADTINEIEMFFKDGSRTTVDVGKFVSMGIFPDVTDLYIDTDPYVDTISSKEVYLEGNFRFTPHDGSDTIVHQVSIRGRGNSSWEWHAKKSYRLKFDKKQSVPGLNKAKSFVLIANYIDNTLLKNVVAYKTAELLQLPYSNPSIPVNFIFNGKNWGSYIMTNKVGINSGSVDINEKRGVLWELDTYFDEDFRFHSTAYQLPCMIKDPDFTEITDGSEEEIERVWEFWKADLDSALNLVKEGRWTDVFDRDQFVKYILVNHVMGNSELAYPKSFYMYKEDAGEKYKMGPVWDFDYALGYTWKAGHPLLWQNEDTPGYGFFKDIFGSEEFMAAFETEFEKFKIDILPQLLEFIDCKAEEIRVSAAKDAEIWPAKHETDWEELDEINLNNFDDHILKLKRFITDRVEYISNSPNYLLYEE